MELDKMHSFDDAIARYHYYRKYWEPEVNQNLYFSYDRDNAFDVFPKKSMRCRREDSWSFTNESVENHKFLNGLRCKIDCNSENDLLPYPFSCRVALRSHAPSMYT